MSDLNALKSKFLRLAEVRQERDVAKKTAENAEKDYRELEAELLEAVEEAGIKKSITFDFGGELGTIQFVPRATIYGRIVDADAALQSFEEQAVVDEMTGTKFEARRLNEFVRDCLENGRELPAGVGFYERKGITISRKGGS